MNPSHMNRRKFLGTAAGLAGALSALGLSRPAFAAVDDYKALVCVYLAGGNDGNNMIVPLDDTRYAAYTRLRAPAGLALSAGAGTLLGARSAQTQAVDAPVTQPFAFHYGMPEIDALYARGQVAAVLNLGNLRQPMTRADYLAGTALPSQLFSHPDQMFQTQAGTPTGGGTGWGGRLVDALGAGGNLAAVSLGGGGLFIEGATTHGNALPSSGTISLQGMNFWPQTAANARRAALLQILGTDTGNVIANGANRALLEGTQLAASLQGAAGTPVATPFPGTALGNQLRTIAQMIRMRMAQGPGRQVYYVTLGGFDTHGAQAWQHFDLLRRLSQAVAAFQAALEEIGAAQRVTTFTASEFGRSLQPSSNGTDHGWGSHQLVIGGAVRGGLYGRFPEFTLGGSDDATGRGVWIPQISNQQFGATLGRWFGVAPAQLATQVFPNELSNFARSDLGFMG